MSDKNRERILLAARQILSAKGPEGITMEEAALQAQLTRKTVYNHFQSRSALLDEVMMRYARESIEGLEGIVADETRPFAERLNEVIVSGFSWMRSWDRMFRRPGIYLAPVSSDGTALRLREELRGFIERVVDEAFEAGIVQSCYESRRIAWVFINMIEGLITLEPVHDEGFGKSEILADSIKAVIAGILNDKGREAMSASVIRTSSPNRVE